MDIAQYIAQNALILIPVLYIIGMIIKNTEQINDKYIPVILLIIGILGAIGIMGVNANSVIQGVLVTGATVYTNQLIKQTSKKE
ncbi:phage holin family protein [Clostridium saccharoperbutylacetonicum]